MPTIEENLMRRSVIGDTLRRIAKKYPRKVALVFGEQTRLTYGELDRLANRFASALLANGLTTGDRVSVVLGNCPEFAVAYYGILKAGMTIVPVNPSVTDEDCTFIIKGSKSATVVAERAWCDRLAAMASDLPDLRLRLSVCSHLAHWINFDDFVGGGSEEEPQIEIHDRDTAQILYTSGTEARPKGIVLSHQAILANSTNVLLDFPFYESDVGLLVLPLHHSGGMDVFLTPLLYVGATMVVLDRFDAKLVLETIQRERVTTFWGLPTFFRALMDIPEFGEYDLSSLRLCTYHMAPMPLTWLEEAMKRFGVDFGLTFGLTEMGPVTTVFRPEHQIEKFGSIGRPIINIDLRIVDDAEQDVRVGTVGEIVYRAPSMMDGYLGLDDKNAEVFRGGWLHSGDLAYADEDGFIFFADRKKDMVKSGGENVSSIEVETALLSHPDIADVAIVGLPHSRWGEAVTAVVVPKGEGVTEDSVISFAKGVLTNFKVPKQVFFVDELPKTNTGKIQKAILRKRFSDGPESAPGAGASASKKSI